jgi:hypothetical protein
MKTPREILLEQHRAAVPKLDAIRRAVVEELNNQDAKMQSWAVNFVASCLGCSNKLWRELIFPCRRIWCGLAAAWVLIFIVNFSQRDNVSSVTGKTVRSSETIMSLEAQQRWMNELFADRSSLPDADRRETLRPSREPKKSRTPSFDL